MRHGQLAGDGIAAVEGGTAKSGEYARVCAIDVVPRAAAVAAIALNGTKIWRSILVDRKRGRLCSRPTTRIRDLCRDGNGTAGIQEAGGIAGGGAASHVGRGRDGVTADR